jgi:Flp pilus assembly protein TadD
MLRIAGRTYVALGDRTTGERMLRDAIEREPNNLDGYVLLGGLYANSGRLAEATEQFRALAVKRPKSISAHTTVAMLLEMQGQVADARAKYEEILQIDPRAPVAANNLAWIYATQGGNLDVALQLAQTAKAQLADRHEVDDTLGWVYHKKGLSALALPSLKLAVDRDPKNASYHYHLGMAYAATGDAARARASLTRALALNSAFDGADEAKRTLAAIQG